MKLSHLSLAIFSAIALAACGGSSSGDQTTPDPKPDPKPKPEDKIKDEDKIVDPAQTGVVGNLDFNTESSVGTTQYIRGTKSKFDRADNPNEATSATSIFGVSVNQQNPYLTNIALARLKDKRYPKQTLVQYLGNDADHPSNYDDVHSLQQQNKYNVELDVSDLTSGTAGNGQVIQVTTSLDPQITALTGIIDKYKEQELTTAGLNDVEQEQLKAAEKSLAELEEIKDAIDNNSKYGYRQFWLDQATAYNWGDGIATDSSVLDYTAQAVPTTPSTLIGPIANGLVSINYTTDGTDTPPKYQGLRIRGLEKNSKSSTRIFGRNFNTDAENTTWNSYMGATSVVLDSGKTTYDTTAPNNFAEAKTKYTAATVKDLKWTLAATPKVLSYVQYGRVTGNLDPIPFTKADIDSGEEFVYKRAKFLNHGDDKAVDTYFYRGPHATSIADMKDVAAGGQVLTYKGHALMYGIDNEFHNKTPNAVPTAFGRTSQHGIGNFVRATVDLEKGRLDDGFVYNVWQQDNDRVVVEDALVRFDGNIYGNTVIGEAQRTYNTSDKADFRASFFGPKANELGGSFNSTTWQERYGAKGDAWGGVFGAKREVEPSAGLSNQQLGDIPPLTQPKAAEETPAG